MFKCSKQQLLDFERKVFDLFEEGNLPYITHLCGGNEDQLIEIFKNIKEDDYVFSTHRAHYHYLLKGGNEDVLLDKIKKGYSMFIFDKDKHFFSSSILAGCAGIAVGVAKTFKLSNSKRKVWCFIGDGAEDEGHFYEAVMYAKGHNLPCIFVIEDNDRSVDTNKKIRRGTDKVFKWPNSHVIRYSYTPIYPHLSTGTGKIVKFNQLVVNEYLNGRSI